MVFRLLLLSSLVLSVVPAARAADQTVLGSALTVRDPGTSAKRKISVTAKEPATDDSLVGDPTAGGATVTVSANGASSSTETYTLPADTSPTHPKPFWTGDAVKGFKYSDSKGENGPVRSAQIRRAGSTFQIKIAVDGKLGPIAVVPPNPGSDGCVLLTIVGGDSYSVQFASGQVTNKGAALFKVAKPTGEGSCVPTTSTTTSTSTSTTTSSTESTSTSTSTTTTSSTSTSTTLPAFPYRTPPGAAPLRYRDQVFGAVTTSTNVTYGSSVNLSGQTVTLPFDLYEPAGDSVTLRPTIIWVHGGSFSSGDKTSPELVDEANTFAKKGYVNASINYRLEPGGCSASVPTTTCVQTIQEATFDAQTAVRFFRTNAAAYGIDETRIAIGGSSAGAITALNVGFGTSEDPTAAVAAALSLSGARILNPINVGDAPSFLMHGTADTIVPYQWAVNTLTQATAAGLDSFLTSWTGAGHVPYVAHRTDILDQSTNFLYWEMDLANAAQ